MFNTCKKTTFVAPPKGSFVQRSGLLKIVADYIAKTHDDDKARYQ